MFSAFTHTLPHILLPVFTPPVKCLLLIHDCVSLQQPAFCSESLEFKVQQLYHLYCLPYAADCGVMLSTVGCST